MVLNSKRLRYGYTTGACAAAAAKAAALLLLDTDENRIPYQVDIPFPDGSRVVFKICNAGVSREGAYPVARASVIKDAGDDPDVTNRAEIAAEVMIKDIEYEQEDVCRDNPTAMPCDPVTIVIKGGKGVGTVTKPGLALPVGEPAINPVPRRMIREAVTEAIVQNMKNTRQIAEVTISVPTGEVLAKKTLNPRLGIIGGISILGTTGIEKPLSSEAWTATISASMDVAKAAGCEEVAFSSGRVSEKAHMLEYNLPVESYVMMGDYVEFSLSGAKKHDFRKIHLCAQWGKMLKIAMCTPQTHVRHGAFDTGKAIGFLNSLEPCAGLFSITKDRTEDYNFNTAREIFEFIIRSPFTNQQSVFRAVFRDVCLKAKGYAELIIGRTPPVTVHLVSYEGKIIETV